MKTIKAEWIGGERNVKPPIGRVVDGSIVHLEQADFDSLKQQGMVKEYAKKKAETGKKIIGG